MKLNNLPFKLTLGVSGLALIGFLVSSLAFTTPPPSVEIENGPLLKPGEATNIALALSVEWPTSGHAYPDVTYTDGKEYIGYFNSNRCYSYPGYAGAPARTSANFATATDYFIPTGFTNTNRYCNQPGTGTGFSGNYLNYVSMSSVDILRLALTGGYRDIDTASLTVLQRATLDQVGGGGTNRTFSPPNSYFSYKELANNLVSKVTPFSVSSGQKVYSASCLDRIHFGNSKTTGSTPNTCNSPGTSQNLNVSFGSGSSAVRVAMKPRVQVCDAAEATLRPDLCLPYPNGTFKPVGELQRKAGAVRVSAFGYLLDADASRYGGVMRAPMKYLGPQQPSATGSSVTNTVAEWYADTGIFIANPLSDTTEPFSGVVNYLNRFGITGNYKNRDPVGELYYETLRYFQGLPPTSTATSGTITAAMRDGSPFYSSWTDPVENACQRNNYVLAIGDVNTHYDRSLPGAGSPAPTASNPIYETVTTLSGDFLRSAQPIPGTTTSLDATYWTRLVSAFETGSNLSYTDATGATRNTLGNPNPRTALTNLDTAKTGYIQAGYNWTGLAYWANTQPIREDIKDGKSMRDVRVRTFTVDVDEVGNGNIEDTNPRGIKPRNSSFYLAGKYGFFRDSNADGNPYNSTLNASNNDEWTGGDVNQYPIGYVVASQAQRMLDAIKSFFQETSKESGALSVSSISSTRFSLSSSSGGKFSPRFDTRDWSGTVLKTTVSLNTVTGNLTESTVPVWDAGAVLTQGSTLPAGVTPTGGQIRPADRKIFTSVGTTTLVAKSFTFAALAADIPASYSTSVVVGTGSIPVSNTLMVNYLRGERTSEIGNPNGTFRKRTNLLGDIVNSGPVYKKEVNSKRFGPGYTAFTAAANSRTGAVYVGAGDGMLHAFRESDAKELFAYIPNALIDSLPALASPTYKRRAFVDAVPEIDEVQIGANWRTVLASGMGGGARGIFALDVTDPDSFSKDNILFEFTNKNDADMGYVVSAPRLVKMRVAGSVPATYKWYVAVTSGYNNYRTNASPSSTTGEQALFLLSLDKTLGQAWVLNDNYFKMSVPVSDSSKANGMSLPSFVLGEADEVTRFYTGDLQGNIWKFAFPDGLSTAKAAIAVKTNGSGAKIPLFTAFATDGTRQPITVAPVPQPIGVAGYMLTFGTGKFLEESDNTSATEQTIYGVWDDGGANVTSYNKLRANLLQKTATAGTSTISISTETFTLGSATGNKRGWYFNLPESRERIAVEGTPGTGFVQFNSTVTGGSCDGGGSSNGYILNYADGTAAAPLVRNTNTGFLSKPIILDIDLETYTKRDVLGRRTAKSEQKSISSGTKIGPTGTNITASVKLQYGRNGLGGAGRLNWREVKDFNGSIGE